MNDDMVRELEINKLVSKPQSFSHSISTISLAPQLVLKLPTRVRHRSD